MLRTWAAKGGVRAWAGPRCRRQADVPAPRPGPATLRIRNYGHAGIIRICRDECVATIGSTGVGRARTCSIERCDGGAIDQGIDLAYNQRMFLGPDELA